MGAGYQGLRYAAGLAQLMEDPRWRMSGTFIASGIASALSHLAGAATNSDAAGNAQSSDIFAAAGRIVQFSNLVADRHYTMEKSPTR